MKKYSIFSIVGIIFLVFILTLIIQVIPAIYSLELKTIDWRFEFRGPLSVEDSPIVLVTIDDQSFDSLPGRWPWPRYYYANVIENLTRAGAKVIGLDVMLDIPDQEEQGRQSDRKLAAAIEKTGNVVLTGKLEERISTGQIRSYQFPVKPIPLFLQADSSWGITAIQADPDGIYRRYFVVQKYQDKLLPSFGLQVLRKYLNIPKDVQPRITRDSVKLGPLAVRLLDDRLMMINFAGPAGSFPSYSFDSVIDDERFDLGVYDLDYFSTSLLPDGVFKDKIVLIGSTVTELHDNFPTPFFEFKNQQGKYQRVEMPGVEIHANAIQTILNSKYFREISNLLSIILILVLIAGVYLLVLRLPTIWAAVSVVGLLGLYVLIQFILFSRFNLIMSMVGPVIAMSLSFVGSNLHQYIITQREKKMIIGAFERFVPQKVVKELLAHPEKLTLGGEERFLTVLFLDLANFTSVSEQLKPAELVNLINLYLTEMTEIVLKYDGIIDKYEGDAIMAEFGAPVYYEDHALKACLAALEMQRRLSRLNLSQFKKVVTRLSCRVGINTGNMIVGNMGSRNVFDYTVMGDAVNLASRLEGANKAYRSSIMVSEDTYQLVKEQVVGRPLDLIRVKGRKKPLRVFELIAAKRDTMPESMKSMLPVFVTGIRYYHHQDWKRAEECFRYCLQLAPGDGPSDLYLRRVTEYVKNPPPQEWDGVFTMQTK